MEMNPFLYVGTVAGYLAPSWGVDGDLTISSTGSHVILSLDGRPLIVVVDDMNDPMVVVEPTKLATDIHHDHPAYIAGIVAGVLGRERLDEWSRADQP